MRDMIYRKETKVLKIGNIAIGGSNPISIQSMTNTKTNNVSATVEQIKRLSAAGCEIVRVAVPDLDSAQAIRNIKSQINIPLIADIHFDYKLAIAAIENGVDGLRLNPGNIGSETKVKEVVARAKEKLIPIRIGVNSGSLSKDIEKRYGLSAEGLVESALEHIRILEKYAYEEIKVSVKAASVKMTIDAYRLLSSKVIYPLHLGVTEAGTEFSGTIKSAVGIGTLLAEGIGDTIRVSLTADPIQEVIVAMEILKSLNLKKGLKIVSCPTCGRTDIDLIALAHQVEKDLLFLKEEDITVAVMGCVVNGPGEAKASDFGIAGGKGEGLIFCKGEIVKKVPEDMLIKELIKVIRTNLGK